MNEFMAVIPVILYILLIILIVVLIVLGIRLIQTLSKVDKIVEDVGQKVNKLNGLFTIIDSTTDFVTSISDKAIGIVADGISGLFNRKKRKEDDNE